MAVNNHTFGRKSRLPPSPGRYYTCPDHIAGAARDSQSRRAGPACEGIVRMLYRTSRSRRLGAAIVLGLLAWTGNHAVGSDRGGLGQRANVQERLPPGYTRHAYAIGDLTGSSRQMADALVKVVTDAVAPDSWMKVGGVAQARCDLGRRELIIVQTPNCQGQVAQLLQSLRQLKREEPPQRMPRGPEHPLPGS
jgi:hypothetical protein